jgi:sRNA-binding carbon storage regulator CsrA
MSSRTNLIVKRKLGESLLIGGRVAVAIAHTNLAARFVTFAIQADGDVAVARSEQRYANLNDGNTLLLRRSLGFSFDIADKGHEVTVTVLKIKPEAVILAVRAPDDLPLLRAELINTPHVVQFRSKLDPAPAA